MTQYYLRYHQWDVCKKGVVVDTSERSQILLAGSYQNALFLAKEATIELKRRLPARADEDGDIYPREFTLVTETEIE